jgi:hypothetical protein
MNPQIGNYGWTPQQMARVNAQRQSRGQQPLLDSRMNDQNYMDQYSSYSPKPQSSGIRKSQYDLEKEKASGTSIKDRIAGMGSASRMKEEQDRLDFMNKFNKMKMLPSGMNNMRGAVSTPTLTSRAYNLIA